MTGSRRVAEAAPVGLSRDLLAAVRARRDAGELADAIAGLDRDEVAGLDADGRRAFWINLYNAGVQLLLEEEPSLYESKRRFFGAERVTVAGERLSLDDIEHGMLRGSQFKYGLGYVPRPFPGGFERACRVERDHRIHFALNCGARSCPAIRGYEPADLDAQLDAAAAAYLAATVTYDPDTNVARVPRHCLWYRGDFGGARGIRAMLHRHDCVPADARPRLRYDGYDWKRNPGNYAE
jgi:hypothetical protein